MRGTLSARIVPLGHETTQEAQTSLWDVPDPAETMLAQAFVQAAEGQFLQQALWHGSSMHPFQVWAVEPSPSPLPLFSSSLLAAAESISTVGTFGLVGLGRLWQAPLTPGLQYTIGPMSLERADSKAGTTDLTRSQIDELLKLLDRFPVCYNQTLLRGSLAYCRRAIGRGAGADKAVLEAILNYVDLIAASITPFLGGVPAGWANLDFTLYSDRFETVQRLCSESGHLPTLEHMTIEDASEA